MLVDEDLQIVHASVTKYMVTYLIMPLVLTLKNIYAMVPPCYDLFGRIALDSVD